MADAKKKTYSTDWQSKDATSAAVKRFEDQFAKDMGIDLGTTNDAYQVVPTGSMNLDYALGIGGVPTGRIVETWGPEAAGKSSLAMLMVSQFQQAYPKKRCAWVDMEQTFSPYWAEKLGVDVDALWRPPAKTAEDTADATRRFVESGLCSFVVLDSIGSMIAKTEFSKEADEATVGLVAKIVTRMVKQCSPMAKSNGTTINVVNQVRAVIGNSYGPDEDTAGGWALKHVTTMKMQVRRGETRTIRTDGKDVPIGHQMNIRVQKNKLAPYGRVAQVWLHNTETEKYGPVGIDGTREVFDLAKRFGLMGDKTSSGTYVLPTKGEPVTLRTEAKVVDYLRDNDEPTQILRKQILGTLSGMVTEDEGGDDPLGIAAMVGG